MVHERGGEDPNRALGECTLAVTVIPHKSQLTVQLCGGSQAKGVLTWSVRSKRSDLTWDKSNRIES